jgi:putative intracellular protease/amidase
LPHTTNWEQPDGSQLVSGRAVTGFSNSEEAAVGLTEIVPFLVEDELRKNGGKYSKGADWQSYSVSDGNLITGGSSTIGAIPEVTAAACRFTRTTTSHDYEGREHYK